MKYSYVVSRFVLCLTVGYVLSIGASVTAATTPSQAPAQNGPPQEAPAPKAPKKLPMPPWAEVGIVNAVDNHPLDKGGRQFVPALGGLPQALKPGFGPSAGIQVQLASGVESYLPMADIIAHNPTGSDAVFQRSFRSDRALQGYGSPGLSPGWVHSYDIVIRPFNASGGWSELSITYPSGEKDYVKPTLDENGAPTGKFQRANGAPFIMQGTPTAAVNQWGALILQWRDAVWHFAPFARDTYVLTQIENMRFAWDERRALSSVTDTTTGKKLLTLSYRPDGYLQSVMDADGRARTYAFGVSPESGVKSPCLLLVSQLYISGEAVPPAQWVYGYTAEGTNLLLSSISVPSPTGQGISACTIVYEKRMVAAHVDANGNRRRYTYSPNHTLVQVVGPSGKVEAFWTQNYDDLGRNTGTTDAEGHSDKIEYGGGAGR